MKRFPQNPIICCQDVAPSRKDFRVLGVFNAGTAHFMGKTILLVRVAETPVQNSEKIAAIPVFHPECGDILIEHLNRDAPNYDFSDPRVITAVNGQSYLTSISHIRKAESSDGIHFTIANRPLLQAFDRYTAFGVEDARVTQLDGRYAVTVSAASSAGIITRLFTTADFTSFEDLGNIFHPDNKDVVIFPEKINGLYYAFHRPCSSQYGKPNLWVAASPDLRHWGNHRLVAEIRPGKWDGGRIGASCVPLRTKWGWLEIYHGATPDNRYCLGAMLLDLQHPWKILARTPFPILEPEQLYEKNGFFSDVVFSCGLLEEEGVLKVYYGACDDSVCLAQIAVNDVLDLLLKEEGFKEPSTGSIFN